jgi:tape measure domain-containing protein
VADQTVTLRMTMNADGVGAGAGQARDAIGSIGPAAESTSDRATRAMDRTAQGADFLTAQISKVRNEVLALGAAWVSIEGVRALAGAADAYSDMQARIRLVADTQAEFSRGQSEAFRIAQDTSSQLEATVGLYTRLDGALGDVGASQAEVLRITETVNKAFAVSGTGGGAAAGAITQLSQAFAAGALRGDEFNSVNEAAPRLMQALAASLGVTRGELRGLAEDGQLTADVLRKALTGDQADAIAEEFAQLPLTIARSMQQLKNAAVQFIGESDQTFGASQAVASGIQLVAQNLDLLAEVTLAAAVVYGARFLPALLPSVATLKAVSAAMVIATTSTSGLAIATRTLGASLLSLVGGPVGVAVLAIGGLALGIKAAMDAEEARDAAFKAGVDSVEQSTERVRELNGQWQQYSSLRRPDVATSIAAFARESEEIRANRIELERLTETYRDLINNAGLVAGDVNSTETAQRWRELTERIAEHDQQSARLADTLRQQLAPELDALQASIDQLANSDGVSAALDGIADAYGALLGLSSRIAADAKFDDLYQQITEGSEAAATALEKAQLGVVGYAQKLAAEFITTGVATGRSRSEVEALGAEYVRLVEQLEATRTAQQRAANETRRATTEAAKAQRELEQANRRSAQASTELSKILDRQAIALGGPGVAAAIAYRDELTQLLDIERTLAATNSLSAEAVAGLAQARDNAAREFTKNLEDAVEQSQEATRSVEDVLADLADTPLNRLLQDIELVGDALELALAGKGTQSVEELRAAMAELQGYLDEMRGSLGAGIVEATSEALRGMQSLTKNGSDAFKAMQVAIDALALVQGISAILNQGTGDPYSAPVRMAAMAAAIAPLIANLAGSIGAFGGSSGFTDTARIRQERQGTGTVLGDAEAKSESILNAMEITADATSELVGINRGMLRALQQLQSGIDSAGGMLARGAGAVEFSWPRDTELNEVGWGRFLSRLGDPIFGTGLLGRFLGGSSRVTDQGLALGGGSLGNIDVRAYEEQQYRSWRFGSRRTREQFAPVGEEFENQFQLIINSLVETVRQGALALGMLPEDIEDALERFRLEEIRISLKDLKPEEQQAELLAVFSSIFDDLAGDVVPFVAQFQRLGEGLGETLVRVATGVQVTREALDRLGFSLDAASPEQFAQISEGLIELSGGIEEFLSGMASFMDNFAPEGRKFELLQSDLTRALTEAGLALPATREGMWALMQSLDATTESGREQIATLLRLSGTADAYYTLLEDRQESAAEALEAQLQAAQDYRNLVAELSDELTSAGMSDFAREMRDIDRWAADAREALHEAARAAGMQAAAEEDLALVHQIASQRAAAAIARLRQAAADLVQDLYGSPLDDIDAQIREIEEAQRASTDSQIGSISEVGDAARGVYQAQLSALQNIRAWLDSQLLGDASSLTPEQRLAEARRQFDQAVAAAQGGDVDALQRVTQLADLLLREERDFSASGQQFTDTEAYVRARMQSLLGLQLADPGTGSTGGAGSIGGAGVGSPFVSPELQALYDRRDALLDEQLAAQREEMVRELGLMVRELIERTGEPLAEVAQTIGLNLTALAADLGINLEELSAETAVSLAALARQLGIDVAELATNVGIELGDLGERQSLLNQALDRTLEQIPEEFRTQLTAPLDAIRSATTDADATAAVEDAEAAIRAMPPAIRELLAPFFEGIGPGPVVSELSTLRDINATATAQLVELGAIRLAIEAIGRRNLPEGTGGLESFDVGTAFVPRTGPALIHRGETILPAAVADFARRSGLTLGPAGGDSAAVVAELRALREENSRGQRALETRLQDLERAQREGTRELTDEQRRAYDRMMMGA